MNRRNAAVARVGIACLLALASASAVSAATIEREFRYPPNRFHVDRARGIVDVDLPGAVREFRPGRPDLPAAAEIVDVPDGMRVAGVRVVDFATVPLAPQIRLLSSMVMKHGLGAIERTAPDPAFFDRSGMQPQIPVTLGYQGFQRGRHIAYLLVSPARWDPVSGRLE